MCIDMGMEMCMGMCIDMNEHMCMDKDIGMCTDMCRHTRTMLARPRRVHAPCVGICHRTRPHTCAVTCRHAITQNALQVITHVATILVYCPLGIGTVGGSRDRPRNILVLIY